jgi:hypothetical protein
VKIRHLALAFLLGAALWALLGGTAAGVIAACQAVTR